MAVVLDIVSWVAIVLGACFMVTGGLGLLRLPDVFARMHGASLIDTLGTALILVGFMFQAGFTLATAKLAMIVVFIFFTTPATTYALARAAMAAGVLPRVDAEGVKRAQKAVDAGREEDET